MSGRGTGAAGRAGAGTPGTARASFAFVALMASLGALNAVSTDIVIPALGRISDGFALSDPNLRQWTIYAVFLGMAASQLLLGPIADGLGRRRAAFLGMGVFLCGCALAAWAPTFELLLAGRALQGLGSGGMRVISIAITRDRFAGDEMARVISLSTAVFVLMVFAAPLAGQALIALGPWRWVFAALAVQGLATALWFATAQPETLPAARRRPIALRPVLRTLAEVATTPATLSCALALGAAFGAFAAYLASAQQVFGEVYGLDLGLPLAFGALSLAYGAMSFANAWAVGRFGAMRLAHGALSVWAGWSGCGFVAFWAVWDGVPPLAVYMAWAAAPVALFALLYGNLQAVALAPMGDRAGSAASAVSAFATACGAVMAAVSGAFFDGTVLPLVATFALAGAAGLAALGGAARRGALA